MYIHLWHAQIWEAWDLVMTKRWKPSFYGGALLGYIVYDLTHYFLHFGTPFTNHQYKMKVLANALIEISIEVTSDL